MNNFVFGVRSEAPANMRLTNGYTLYEWAMRKNCPPAFWAKSITGEITASKEELEFLRDKNCKIALLTDDLDENTVSTVNGKADALRAADAAKKLGVPADGTYAIFAVIHDDWTVLNGWMISFADTLRENGYLPGFIGNTDSSLNFNFDRQYSHLIEAGHTAICFATKPEIEGEPIDWTPYAPSAIDPDDVELWQTKTDVYKQLPYNCIYGRDEKVLDYMWLYTGSEE